MFAVIGAGCDLGSELAGFFCQKANYLEITPAQYEEDLEWLLDEKVIARC